MSQAAAVNGAHKSTLPAYVVEVAPKLGFGDPPGLTLFHQLSSVGVSGIREVRVGALYEIRGRLSPSQMHHLCRELLCDPITQDYRIDTSTASTAFLIGPHWRVEVWLKPQVTDPVGETVRKAVADLGLPEPESVRAGTAYQLLGRIARPQADRIVRSLLANPVIHMTRISQT